MQASSQASVDVNVKKKRSNVLNSLKTNAKMADDARASVSHHGRLHSGRVMRPARHPPSFAKDISRFTAPIVSTTTGTEPTVSCEKKRDPVPSRYLPPKSIVKVDADLAKIGYQHAEAEPDGNCFVYSSMTGFEISKAEANNPDAKTIRIVRKARMASIDKICGDEDIGGIAATTVRAVEKIRKTSVAAKKQMAPWKKNFHWDGGGNLAAFWQFATALHLGRPIAVIEKKNGTEYNDPGRVYGALDDATGELRCSDARGTKPKTVPSYHVMSIADIIDNLRTTPKKMSLILYNGVDHFDPFVYNGKRKRGA